MSLTAERLREVFSYDAETGLFCCLAVHPNQTRGRKVGDVMAGYPGPRGRYLVIGIDRKAYYAHRLAFLWMTGRWPAVEIDHIDLITTNNRWVNLREATHIQNQGNQGPRKKNSCGLKGVRLDSRSGTDRWDAKIRVDGKQIHLGCFDSKEDAAAAYEFAALAHYGKFARV